MRVTFGRQSVSLTDPVERYSFSSIDLSRTFVDHTEKESFRPVSIAPPALPWVFSAVARSMAVAVVAVALLVLRVRMLQLALLLDQ